MLFYIDDPETDQMVQSLARMRGETVEAVLRRAIREQWQREGATASRTKEWTDRLRAIAHECASLPTLDERSADEILGYDEHGLPT